MFLQSFQKNNSHVRDQDPSLQIEKSVQENQLYPNIVNLNIDDGESEDDGVGDCDEMNNDMSCNYN